MSVSPLLQTPASVRALSCAMAVALGVVGCGHRQRPTPSAPVVQTSIAQFGSIQPFERLAGIIAPYENVAIQSTLSEPADSVNVQEGDRVSRGEVIAQLDTADLQAQLAADLATANSTHANTSHTIYQGSLAISQGQDTLRAAQAALTRDDADLVRYQALYAKGYVSQQQLATEEATVRNDQSTLASAQSAVQANGTLSSSGLQRASVEQSQAQEQVAQAQARQERVAIAKATILSPIDGVVVNRNINPGEYPGTRQIFTLQQVNPIYAVLHGSDEQIVGIQPGARVSIATGNLGQGTFSGTVVGVLNEVVPGSTDFQIKVVLQNPRQQLRPGMAVQGTILLPSVRGVRIPATAYTDDNRDAVLTVAPDGTVKTTKVSEVSTDGTSSIVKGISTETRVVTDGQTSVGDGEKIVYQGENPQTGNTQAETISR